MRGTCNSQIQRDGKQNGGCQGLGAGRNVELFHGYKVSVLQVKTSGDGSNHKTNVFRGHT